MTNFVSSQQTRLKAVFAILIASFFLCLCLWSPAKAHEQKVAITQILFNPNTGNIEIAHRLNLHDAEHAVQEGWGEADLTSDPENLERLTHYVRGNFFLYDGERLLESKKVGAEIDGIYVWIYDELPIPKKRIKVLTVDNTILRDVWPDQSNLVNLELGNFRESVFFSGDDREKQIIIEKVPAKK